MIPGAKPEGQNLVVSAPFDGSAIAEVETGRGEAVKLALKTAHHLFRNKDGWLSTPQRIEILEKTARIMQNESKSLALEAAREGGKPLIDSRVEVTRAIDGVKECIESLRTQSGEEVPMRLNTASVNRLAVTRLEPIGVVVAVSAFNHPLNLIIHQVGPAVAVGCPVIVKPAGPVVERANFASGALGFFLLPARIRSHVKKHVRRRP